jgi:multidrug efflux pump subunit AcrB
VSRELHGEPAVVFSLFVARLLTRVMGTYFLKPHHTVNKPGKVMEAYLRLVQWGRAHRKLALLSGVARIGGSVAIALFLETTFIQASDRGSLRARRPARAVRIMASVQLGRTLDEAAVASVVSFLESLTGAVPSNYAPPGQKPEM